MVEKTQTTRKHCKCGFLGDRYGADIDWMRDTIGTDEYPCLAKHESPKNVGQLAQQISDFGDDLTHEELCGWLSNFAFKVKHGQI